MPEPILQFLVDVPSSVFIRATSDVLVLILGEIVGLRQSAGKHTVLCIGFVTVLRITVLRISVRTTYKTLTLDRYVLPAVARTIAYNAPVLP